MQIRTQQQPKNNVIPRRSSKSSLTRSNGYILLTSLFALVLLAGAASLVFSIVVSEQRQQHRHRQLLELRAMNDGLIAETLAEVAHSGDFQGVGQGSVGSGTGETRVTKITASRSYIKTTASLRGNVLVTGTMINVTTPVPRVLSWQRLPKK